MAEQTIKGYILIPDQLLSININFNSMLIDAASEKAASIVQASKTGTISKVGFLTGTVTTGDTVDVRLETVSAANGDPTGTLLGTNSNGSQVIADADDNTWFLTTLTTGVAVTKGDIFAVVIVNGAAPGNLNIKAAAKPVSYDMFPYNDLYETSWTKRGYDCPCVAFEYSDGSYETMTGVWPVSAFNTYAFNNTSTPDHRGLKFKLPFPFRLIGFWALLDLDENVDVKLYDSDGTTVLETLSIDKDIRWVNNYGFHHYYFVSNHSLLKDVFYRLVFEPTTTTSIGLHTFSVNAAAIMDSFAGGQNFHATSKKDAGWTDVTTERPLMNLLIDGFDDGAGGGGGGARNPLGVI